MEALALRRWPVRTLTRFHYWTHDFSRLHAKYVETTPKDCCPLAPSSKRKKYPEILAPRSANPPLKYMVLR